MTDIRAKHDKRNHYISPLSITITLIFNYLINGSIECSKEKVTSYYETLRNTLKPYRPSTACNVGICGHTTVYTHYYEELQKDVYEYDKETESFRLKPPYLKGESDLEKIWLKHIIKHWRKYIAIQPEDFILATTSEKVLTALLGSAVADREKATITKFVFDNTPQINPVSIMLALTLQYLAFGEISCTNEQINRYAIEINNALSNDKNDFLYIFPSIKYNRTSEEVYYWDDDKTSRILSQEYRFGEVSIEKLCSKYLSNLPKKFLDTAISIDALAVLFATRIIDVTYDINLITEFITNNTKVKGYARTKVKEEKHQPKVGE